MRNEFLLNEGINFDDLPTWQRGGVGLYWEQYNKDGYNPLKRETVTTTRRRLKVDLELSTGTAYQQFIEGLLRGSTLPSEA